MHVCSFKDRVLRVYSCHSLLSWGEFRELHLQCCQQDKLMPPPSAANTEEVLTKPRYEHTELKRSHETLLVGSKDICRGLSNRL